MRGGPTGEGADRLVVHGSGVLLRRLLPLVAAVAPLTLVLLMETLPTEPALAARAWPVRGLWRLWEIAFYLAVLVICQLVAGGVWQALRPRAVLRLDPGGVTDNRDGSPIASWDQIAAVEQGTTTLDAGSVRKPRRKYGRMHNDRFPVLVLRLDPSASAGSDTSAPVRVGEVVHLDIEDRSSPPAEIVEFGRRLHARYHDDPPPVTPAPLPSRGLAKGLLLVGLSLVLALGSFLTGVTIVEPELSADAPSERGPVGAETYHVGTFTVSSVEVVEDAFGDFSATVTVTNRGVQRTDRSAIELTLLRAGREVGRVSARVLPLSPGASERIELWGADDYVEGVDELVFRIG